VLVVARAFLKVVSTLICIYFSFNAVFRVLFITFTYCCKGVCMVSGRCYAVVTVF